MHPYFEDYWPWYVTAWGLYALGGLLLAWALFWDRAKRGGQVRHRCPKCWYDMQGVAELDPWPADTCCPECGRELKHCKDLLRTRKHGRLVILAMWIALFGYWSQCVPRMRVHYRSITLDAMTAFIPSSFLILASFPDRANDIPLVELKSGDGLAWNELLDRRDDDRTLLWKWQNRILAWRLKRHLIQTTNYGIRDPERELFDRLVNKPYRGPGSFPDFESFATTINRIEDVRVAITSGVSPLGDFKFPNNASNSWTVLETSVNDLGNWNFFDSIKWVVQDDKVLFVQEVEHQRYNRTAMYDISDLISPEETLGWQESRDQIADLVYEHVEPESWYELGGDIGHIGIIADHLIANTSVCNHLAIEAFLALLRKQKPEFNLYLPRVDIGDGGSLELKVLIQPVTRLYEVSDLITSMSPAVTLESLHYHICDFLAPNHWRDYGGEIGSISRHNSTLLVTTTSDVHEHLVLLLNMLRYADAPSMKPPYPVDPSIEPLPQDVHIRTYHLDQILSDADSAWTLMDELCFTIDPDHWRSNGGEFGEGLYLGGRLTIQTTLSNHEAISKRFSVLEDKINQGMTFEQAITEISKMASTSKD